MVSELVNGDRYALAFAIGLTSDGNGETLRKIHDTIQNSMDKHSMAILLTGSGVGLLETNQDIIHILSAIFADCVQRFFQSIVAGRISADAITAGAILLIFILIELVITIGADHLGGDAQHLQLPVHRCAAPSTEGIATNGFQCRFICTFDLLGDAILLGLCRG